MSAGCGESWGCWRPLAGRSTRPSGSERRVAPHHELVDVHARVDGDFPPEVRLELGSLDAVRGVVGQQLAQALEVVVGRGRVSRAHYG